MKLGERKGRKKERWGCLGGNDTLPRSNQPDPANKSHLFWPWQQEVIPRTNRAPGNWGERQTGAGTSSICSCSAQVLDLQPLGVMVQLPAGLGARREGLVGLGGVARAQPTASARGRTAHSSAGLVS